MHRTSRKLAVGVAALSLSGALFTGAAGAQTRQQGLVNVNVTDVTVQIPVGVAANVCDVDVNVLTSGLLSGPTDCQAGTIALADSSGGGGGSTQQSGLINVNLQDVDAQVPIAIAANVCGVSVNVLVQLVGDGPVDCTAFGRSATVSQ